MSDEAKRAEVEARNWSHSVVWSKGQPDRMRFYICHATDGDDCVGPFHTAAEAECALAALRSAVGAPRGQTGIERIAAERRRQVEREGWTPEHDDEHTDYSLAYAAACYAIPAFSLVIDRYQLWPGSWHRDWWKPSPYDRIRELEKAGALIAAEIDRLLRASPQQQRDTETGQ